MSAENLKSAFITNVTAIPRVLTNAPIARGQNYSAVGYIAPAAAAEAASTYAFIRVPSSAVLRRLFLNSADFTTAGTVHIGLRRTAEDGAAVVDADAFVASLALTGGPFAESNQLRGNIFTIAKAEQPIWQVLGLSADPGVMYEIYMTVTVAFNGGQPILLEASWAE